MCSQSELATDGGLEISAGRRIWQTIKQSKVHMAHFEIDISEFDPFARAVLVAALAHARAHRGTQSHSLLLEDFYRLAGIGGEVYVVNFFGAVADAMKAAVMSPDYDAETLRGWPVFDSISVTRTRFDFAINAAALDASEFPLNRDEVRQKLAKAQQ